MALKTSGPLPSQVSRLPDKHVFQELADINQLCFRLYKLGFGLVHDIFRLGDKRPSIRVEDGTYPFVCIDLSFIGRLLLHFYGRRSVHPRRGLRRMCLLQKNSQQNERICKSSPTEDGFANPKVRFFVRLV